MVETTPPGLRQQPLLTGPASLLIGAEQLPIVVHQNGGRVRAAGQTLQIHVLGLASIADDVTPELARATISSLEVLGALRASPEVKAALSDRAR